ncbi:MAG: Holliday junction resolvase RuvX [Phycisphaera sp.]|nr:MAG: Holliday junction resolvase RuvX [Phycisphaera sp.]
MAFTPRITRYIAIDLGDRRTGLAVGDTHTRVAAPWKTLEVPIEHEGGQKLIDAIERAIDRDYASSPSLELVVGLPLHLDGQESQRSELARAFADRLAKHFGKPVHLADERLTSKQADWAMGGSGLTHLQKKRRRDSIAAAALLQAFLNTLPAEGNDDDAHPNNEDG